MRSTGFTLAELLISMAVCGLISTFAIQKVLVALEDSNRRAVFKETIATLQGLQDEGMNTGAMTGANFGTYFLSKLNAVKVCSANSTSEGCWTPGVQGTPPFETTQPGLILANGAQVVGFDNCCAPPLSGRVAGEHSNRVVLDWNGLKGPNQLVADQFHLLLCFGTSTCTVFVPSPIRPGQILPTNAAEVIPYQEIFIR